GGHRHIVELFRQLVAILVGPVEEFQNRGGTLGMVLLFVHQDERRAGDRPALLARLVGQEQVEARRLGPIGVGGGGLKGLVVGRDKGAVMVLQQRVGHLVLQRVGVLDIADRAVG